MGLHYLLTQSEFLFLCSIGCLIAVQLQTQLDQLISVFSITTSYWADVWTAMSQTWDVWFLGNTSDKVFSKLLIIKDAHCLPPYS